MIQLLHERSEIEKREGKVGIRPHDGSHLEWYRFASPRTNMKLSAMYAFVALGAVIHAINVYNIACMGVVNMALGR